MELGWLPACRPQGVNELQQDELRSTVNHELGHRHEPINHEGVGATTTRDSRREEKQIVSEQRIVWLSPIERPEPVPVTGGR